MPTSPDAITSCEALIFPEWAELELNHRPHAYQACALTAELLAQEFVNGDLDITVTNPRFGECQDRLS